jgi:hypothetical protein
VRISGIKEEVQETVEQVEGEVLQLFADTGVSVKPEDIAAVHRVGGRGGGGAGRPRQIIVKFVSRRTRRQVMQRKKELKGKDKYSGVYLNDDLTPMRAKLLKYVKGLDIVDQARTIDGKIYMKKKLPVGHPNAATQRPVIIETPDELFDKLGVRLRPEDFMSLGLGHFIDCAEE